MIRSVVQFPRAQVALEELLVKHQRSPVDEGIGSRTKGQQITVRMGLSRKICRFVLPMDMKELENLTALEYLRRYCFVCSRRQNYYNKSFDKFDRDRDGILSLKEMERALKDVYTDDITSEKVQELAELVRAVSETQFDRQLFGAMCAVYGYMRFISNETKPCYGVAVTKYDRKGYKARQRQLLLTQNSAFIVEEAKLKQRIDYSIMKGISVSSLSDGLFVLHVPCEDNKQKGDVILQSDHVIETLTKVAMSADKVNNLNITQGSIKFTVGQGKEGIIDFTSGSELLITKAKNGHLSVASDQLRKMCMQNMMLSYCKQINPEWKNQLEQKCIASEIFKEKKDNYPQSVPKLFVNSRLGKLPCSPQRVHMATAGPRERESDAVQWQGCVL
ncbi:Unconventional myosin-Ic [Acipenser ruthenus]|uniref:Unconventional myosin-Ic n=1 Tax=Acipenser ruthenus TaxID=7906 RepID=A0A444V0G6_ACIRT|nr:Unconventional myosin-Ic [Acipenser ruthenus]